MISLMKRTVVSKVATIVDCPGGTAGVPSAGLEVNDVSVPHIDVSSVCTAACPPPVNLKGTVQTAVKAAIAEKPTLLMDKLGERLAFERTGTRLYEALASKHSAFGSFAGRPRRDDLAHVPQEEYRHFTILQSAIEPLGGDPTAVTPAANLHATAAHGINQVIVDPRTTLLQSLEALLIAELAQAAGEDKLVQQFEWARMAAQEHLEEV